MMTNTNPKNMKNLGNIISKIFTLIGAILIFIHERELKSKYKKSFQRIKQKINEQLRPDNTLKLPILSTSDKYVIAYDFSFGKLFVLLGILIKIGIYIYIFNNS